MRTIETRATVSTEGTIAIQVPADIPPGEHRVVVGIEEATSTAPRALAEPLSSLKVMEWGAWPPDSTFRREDLYSDERQ